MEYYFTDLFMALTDKRNHYPGHRQHPVLLALLYSFCPKAARWWMSGADPKPPYDAVWDALQMYATGQSLREVLESRGVGDLREYIKKYISSVEAYRNSPTTNYRGSELSPVFTGDVIPVTARMGLQSYFDQYFGGDWRNLLRFARAWAFFLPDWRADMGIQPSEQTEIRFAAISVALSVPRLNWKTIAWPAWAWYVKIERVTRVFVGALVNQAGNDELRFSLLLNSRGYYLPDTTDLTLWTNTPAVYALENQVGQAYPVNLCTDSVRLVQLIPSMAAIAKNQACLPLGILEGGAKCGKCGFRELCFSTSGEATSILYDHILDEGQKAEKAGIL